MRPAALTLSGGVRRGLALVGQLGWIHQFWLVCAGSVKVRQRFVAAAYLQIDKAAEEEPPNVIGVELDNVVKIGERLVEVPEHGTKEGKDGETVLLVTRVELDQAEIGKHLVSASHRAVSLDAKEHILDVSWVELAGPAKIDCRLVIAAQRPVAPAAEYEGQGEIGIEFEGAVEVDERFLVTLHLVIGLAAGGDRLGAV